MGKNDRRRAILCGLDLAGPLLVFPEIAIVDDGAIPRRWQPHGLTTILGAGDQVRNIVRNIFRAKRLTLQAFQMVVFVGRNKLGRFSPMAQNRNGFANRPLDPAAEAFGQLRCGDRLCHYRISKIDQSCMTFPYIQ